MGDHLWWRCLGGNYRIAMGSYDFRSKFCTFVSDCFILQQRFGSYMNFTYTSAPEPSRRCLVPTTNRGVTDLWPRQRDGGILQRIPTRIVPTGEGVVRVVRMVRSRHLGGVVVDALRHVLRSYRDRVDEHLRPACPNAFRRV